MVLVICSMPLYSAFLDHTCLLCLSRVLLSCLRLLADLNSPLFVPDPISLDRKHILEDIEHKYRDFITAALRCLTELKRELCECRLWRHAQMFTGVATG